MKPKICVIGSLNMDLVTETEYIPKMGESMYGLSFNTYSGGKGGNQAVAASHLGADTFMIGCVGNDSFGADLIKELSENGVNTDFISKTSETTTGVATIIVCNNDNCIIVKNGANEKNTIEMIEKNIFKILKSDILVLQNEIPMEVNKYIMEKAKNKVRVIYNHAPFSAVCKELLKLVTVLIVNEHECAGILERDIETLEDAKNAVMEIHSWGVENVIVTMGKLGSVYNDKDKFIEVKSREVKAVDTTAAGDTFCGAIAVSLACGLDINEAVEYANLSASITVTKKGAQASIPYYSEVLALPEAKDIKLKFD